MASVIDLTDDLRAELAMAQNLGAGFGAAAGHIVADHRRRKLEQMIVATIQDAETRGLNAAAIRKELIKNAQIVRDKHGQEVIQIYGQQAQIEQNEKLRGAQAKYWENKAGGGGVSSTEFSRWQSNRKRAQEGYEEAETRGDTKTMKFYEAQIKTAEQMLNSMTGNQTNAVTGEDFDRIDLSEIRRYQQPPAVAQAGTPQVTQQEITGPPKPDMFAYGKGLPTQAGSFTKPRIQSPGIDVYGPQDVFTENKNDTTIAVELNKQNFAPYMDKLDGESKQQLQVILAEGNPQKIQIALERLRQTYGTL